MHRLAKGLLATAGVAMTLFSTTAVAVLDVITVTAERREGSLQETPIAVTALSTESLENLQITEAQDLQRYVPSLNMFQNITQPTNLSLSLRGGLQQDASIVAAESPLGIYVDDVYIGRLNGNNVTLADIERVEVLRGPQGTLYGRNTGYGAIKFISRSPGDEPWFEASAGYGSDDQQLLSTTFGGPLNDDWAGSLAARYSSKDGQFFNVAENIDVGAEDNFAIRGKLRYIGSDDFDAVLSVSFAEADNDSATLVNATTPNVGDDFQFTTDDLNFTNGEFNTNTAFMQLQPAPLRDRPQAGTNQTIVSLATTLDVSDELTVKAIAGYVQTEDHFHTDFNGNTAGGGGFTGGSEVDADQISLELQALGTLFDDRLNYLGGIFLMNEDSRQDFGWHFGNRLSQSRIENETDSVSVFGEVSYNVTDALKLTGGLRWTSDDKDFLFAFQRFDDNLFNTVIAPGFFPATTEIIQLDGDYDEVTPRVAIDYNFGEFSVFDSLLLYVQAAEGFKGGGFSAIALASTFPVGAYDPETNWTYEGGIKAEWFDNRLRTNLAYFWSDIEDIQQNATVVGSAGFEFPVQNSGDAEIYGLEFEITLAPFDGLNIFANGTAFMDGEFQNLNPNSAAAAAPLLFQNVNEPDTPQTGDYAISIGFDYTFDLPGNFVDDVTIGGDYYEIDDYVTAATNDFNNSGWELWNAFIKANIGDNVELKLTGKNLSDDFIVTSGSRGLGGFIALPPREIMFTVTFRQ